MCWKTPEMRLANEIREKSKWVVDSFFLRGLTSPGFSKNRIFFFAFSYSYAHKESLCQRNFQYLFYFLRYEPPNPRAAIFITCKTKCLRGVAYPENSKKSIFFLHFLIAIPIKNHGATGFFGTSFSFRDMSF